MSIELMIGVASGNYSASRSHSATANSRRLAKLELYIFDSRERSYRCFVASKVATILEARRLLLYTQVEGSLCETCDRTQSA